ncbi:MAG: RHS repeat-associated core domain-containing protein [Terriglobia bacterium]|nr:RHS repeat-associated core domain-containing protein [Terriglobia bacterium]
MNCGSIWSQSFGFDPFGNINKTGSQSFTPTYSNSTNQINGGGYSQSYDANGNLLTINDGTTHTYTWDAEGKQLGIDSFSAIYDALGRMVELNSSGTYTETVYGLAGEKLALMNGQTLKNAFVATPSGTAVYVPTGLLYYRHADWLGSSRFASTTGRAMYSSSAYAPFGEQYAKAGTNDQNFTGQQPDTAAGLYDFLFRRLSQTQGRWISPDPAGLGAVDPTAPQSWNRYGYVQNTPLRFVDLLGLDEAAPSWDCYSYASCEIFVSGSGFVGGWVPDTWSAGGCQDIYSDGNYVGNTCGGRQQQASQSTGDAKPTNTANNGFTIGIRAPGQTYSQCLASNTGNYSIAGVFNIQNSAGKFLAGNDAGNLLFGDASKGQAGLLLSHGGATAVSAGVGTAGTFGRRTASIFDLNLSGTTGPAPTILGKTGAEEVAGVLSGIAEIKFAIDVGLTGAEAIGCAFHR